MPVSLFAVLSLALSGYLAWWGITMAAPVWLVLSVVLFITALGLFRSKRWSQYLWHSLSGAAVLLWSISLIRLVVSGWPYSGALESAVSLLPGAALLVVCVAGSFVIRKHFRSEPRAR